MGGRMSAARVVAAAAVTLACAGALTATTAAAASFTVQSITPWLRNAAPIGWSASTNRVFYDSIGTDGLFNGYSANPDGSDPVCITCSAPSFAGVGTATNRGISDVSPDGKYLLVTVEDGVHAGQIGATWTQPGKGGANDVWLYTADGSQAWPLTDIAAQGSLGSIWPRFDRTGNEIVWASMTAPALANLGYWQLKVANIVWNGGVPSLADVRTIEPYPDSFYEPYGFTPDDSRILFASNAGMPSWMDDEIDEVGTDGSGFTTLTTPPAGALAYNEFAFFMPGDAAIIYGSSVDALSGGMDYWAMNPDGSGKEQLTAFNDPFSGESLGYSIVEGLAFNPADPNQFIASVASDANSQNVNGEVITLAAPPASGGSAGTAPTPPPPPPAVGAPPAAPEQLAGTGQWKTTTTAKRPSSRPARHSQRRRARMRKRRRRGNGWRCRARRRGRRRCVRAT